MAALGKHAQLAWIRGYLLTCPVVAVLWPINCSVQAATTEVSATASEAKLNSEPSLKELYQPFVPPPATDYNPASIDLFGVGNPPRPKTSPTSNPRDFSGHWKPRGMRMAFLPQEGAREDGLPPFTPEGEKIFKYRLLMTAHGTPVPDPVVYCRPAGLMREILLLWNVDVLQDNDMIIQVFQEYSDARTIHLSRSHPKDLKSTYMGDSVGHWEGNTLVVDTIGYNGETRLDLAGTPHGSQLRTTERIRKIDEGNVLEDVVTIDDPQYYTRGFSLRVLYDYRPDLRVPEMICEEQIRATIVDGLLVQ
jgi:hypothetical protein